MEVNPKTDPDAEQTNPVGQAVPAGQEVLSCIKHFHNSTVEPLITQMKDKLEKWYNITW